jgi:hypothetical protein
MADDAGQVSEIGANITLEQLGKIRARHADLAEALAKDDPSLIESD